MILWLSHCEVVIDSDNLSRSSIVRTKTITTANDLNLTDEAKLGKSINNVEVERLRVSTWLLSTIEDANLLDRSRQSLLEILERERTVEVNTDQTYLLALCNLIVNDLLDTLGSRAHSNDDIFGIWCSVVVEWTVLAASNSRNLIHVLGNDIWNCLVVWIRRLTVSEEHIWVLGHTTHLRMLRRESTLTESLNSIPVNKRTEILLVNNLNLLILVRCAETIEEVEERNAACESSEVSNCRDIHNFLY